MEVMRQIYQKLNQLKEYQANIFIIVSYDIWICTSYQIR